MDINNPYVPTATQIAEATPFTNFDAKLAIEYDEVASKALGKDYYRVLKSFRFYRSAEDRATWGYVPAGFLTDGASVPRPLWWLVPPWGAYGQAATLHDILCETKTLFHNEIPVTITRKEADTIFLEAMKATGVSWVTRTAMYGAVRAWSIFGGKTNMARLIRKRQIETEYMRQAGTYREPTAILRQVTVALDKRRRAESAAALAAN